MALAEQPAPYRASGVQSAGGGQEAERPLVRQRRGPLGEGTGAHGPRLGPACTTGLVAGTIFSMRVHIQSCKTLL